MERALQKGIALFLAALCLLSHAAPALAAEGYVVERSESVYVDLAHDGSPLSVVSSVYLTNADKAQELRDYSSLTDIENVLGSERPLREGDCLIFNAEGEDVCYQGTASDAALPVTLRIHYSLDGKAVSAEELAGKSGYVGVHIESFNHAKHTVEVEGVETELCTPFSVICMLTLNEGFSMLQSDNGRITAEAGSTTVMALLQPGLQESLGMEEEGFHDEFRLWAQVEDFSIDSILCIVMAGMLDKEDLSRLDDMQELIDGVDELAEASDELYDGTAELRDGVEEYADGVREFNDGLIEFREGLAEYAFGVDKLYDGIGELLDGTRQLASGAEELHAGAKTFEDSLSKAMADSSGAVQFAQGTAAIINQQALNSKLTDAELAAVQQSLQIAYQSASQQQMMQLLGAISQLTDGIGQYASGVESYGAGVRKLYDGAFELKLGTGELRDGAKELHEEGGMELLDGAEEMRDGTAELVDGVDEFRTEGVYEMRAELEDMRRALARKDALLELGESYTAYSATRPLGSAAVQFIMTTETIQAEKPIETQVPVPAEDGNTARVEVEVEAGGEASWWERLWTRVRGWFGIE